MAIKQTSSKPSSGLLTLKKIIERTSGHTGKKFFQTLVKTLAETLDTHGVWVTEYLSETRRLNALAFWLGDRFIDKYEYDIAGTPCEPVIEGRNICHFPDRVIELFPGDPDLVSMEAVSYVGLALMDEDGKVMGHLAMLDNKPLNEIPDTFAIFNVFAIRAEAEFKRLKYERLLQDNEAKLNRLLNGAMDGIIEFNDDLVITQINQSVQKMFSVKTDTLTGTNIEELLTPNGFKKLLHCMNHLQGQTDHFCSTFIQGNVGFIKSTHQTFPAETTLSKYRSGNKDFYALIIRNVEDRIKDKQELKRLNVETVMLREKVNAQNFDAILGSSKAINKAKALVSQVAPLDSTVLIFGETGTGKELFARAIHKSSERKGKPMITLNCAALPSELVESELFGHIKGAFTGATSNREGRFLLADNGTIFLDEIGELPLSLQAKLLRVLQEGEFEPVGSSKTQKVNVRVIAATHRDLANEVEKGKFREDLFYRLNVFPVNVPPLRERGKDILLLTEAFVQKIASRTRSSIDTIDEGCRQRLLNYPWPGNIRELQNVIERAVITAVNGKLNLEGILTAGSGTRVLAEVEDGRVFTEAEMIALEKENIVRALDLTDWKISGEGGASMLLEIPPTTLRSRMGKLGIKKD